MSIALRRKMFKLGGSTNTHGMGLTSGLTMKKGPDGKPREAKFLGALVQGAGRLGIMGAKALAPGAARLLRTARSADPLRSARSFIRGRPTLGPETVARTASMRGKFGGIRDLITATSREALPRTATQRLGQAGRAALLGLPFAQAGLAFGPTIDTDEKSSLGLRGLELLQDAARLPVQIPVSIADTLMGTGEEFGENIMGFGPISQSVFGTKPKKEIEVDTGKADKIKAIKAKSKEELKAENDQRVQEYYEKLGGEGINKFEALGAGLVAAAPALLEEDYGGAAVSFQEGMQPSIQRERDLQDAAATLAIGEEQADDAADRELRTTLLATGDTDSYTRITKVMDAEEELGIGNVEGLPVKGNNKIDTKQLRRGRIYTDVTGATKAKYVVIDQGGMDHYTNSAEEAKQLVELV